MSVFRALLLAVCCGAVLAGCGGSSSGGDDVPGTDNPVPPAPNALVATLSTPVVNAKQNGGSQQLSISFNSSDGQPLTALTVEGLSALPAGWSSESQFSCGTVSTGNSCVLNLTYTPAGAQQGVVTLSYSYINNTGATVNGSVEVPYQATSDNNVVTAQSPAGQVVGIVGQSAQSVLVDFGSDDGAAITALELTTDFGTLPAGWSVQTNPLPCATIDFGHVCALQLSYAPQAVENGTLVLNYEYVDNSGVAKTGAVGIAYAGTVSNNVVANASSTHINTRLGASKQTTVTFITDDSNTASDLEIAPSLPTGWSADVSGCASVSTGNGCEVTLTYAPSAAATGTLNLDYSYTDNSGQAKTGSLNVNYFAREVFAYIPDLFTGLKYCAIAGNGTFSSCQTANTGLSLISGIAFHEDHAFVSSISGTVSRCDVGHDGDVSNCSTFTSSALAPDQLAANDTHLYAINFNIGGNSTSSCSFADGSCMQTSSIAAGTGISLDGQRAYISRGGVASVATCTIQPDGDLSSCFYNAAFSEPLGSAIANGRFYVADPGADSITVCTIDSTTGGLSGCSSALSITDPSEIQLAGGYAYIGVANGVNRCEVQGNGSLQNCVSAIAGVVFQAPRQIVVD